MSPESNGATLVGVFIGLCSFIAGGVATILGVGKKIQRFESSLTRSHERHDETQKKYESLEQAIRTLTAAFIREDGEPRFTTSIVCAREQAECHAALAEKFAAGQERFGNLERKVEEIKDAQAQNFQDIITEIRSNR